MLKKKLLISLVIVQGLFIFIGIIAIIFGVFYKMNMINKSPNLMNENIDFSNIYLIDKNQYQQKIIRDDKVIFQIIDIETNKILREIIIEKN